MPHLISDLMEKLACGSMTSAALVEDALDQIYQQNSKMSAAFVKTYDEQARAQARWIDQARAQGVWLPACAGIPIAVKDLFDVSGEVTRAGARARDHLPAASEDAVIISRLRQAGFIIIGKNNMTEFAYSGLGINPHYGTPRNPCDAAQFRIPGGSSSGAAVSVAGQMVPAAVGSDTGGSCRIPAAFCGVTGFKPTSTRISKKGAIPLSPTLDSIGPLAHSVNCCAILDSILAGSQSCDARGGHLDHIRLGVVEGLVTRDLDDHVANAAAQCLSRLSAKGVTLIPIRISDLDAFPEINAKGGYVGAEAYAEHADLLAERGEMYDPWVRARLEASQHMTARDYIELGRHRARLRGIVFAAMKRVDAFILPTVAIVPPTLDSLQDDSTSRRINKLCLRNTSIGNFLDVPAISLPCHELGSLPVGVMLMGLPNHDRDLLMLANQLENAIRATNMRQAA